MIKADCSKSEICLWSITSKHVASSIDWYELICSRYIYSSKHDETLDYLFYRVTKNIPAWKSLELKFTYKVELVIATFAFSQIDFFKYFFWQRWSSKTKARSLWVFRKLRHIDDMIWYYIKPDLNKWISLYDKVMSQVWWNKFEKICSQRWLIFRYS